MTKRRARNQEGEYAGDNPATPDVNEAWVETPSESPKEEKSLPIEPVVAEPLEELAAVEAVVKVPAIVEPAGTEPAVVKLKTSDTTELKGKQSKEAIEASVQEKLSKRSSEEVDPFVPSAQLQKEVKEIAKQGGFPLTRGTEAGAALIARARRQAKS
jgi:hypothetical protein